MIAHISGIVSEKMIDSVIVDVNGVGYEIKVPQSDYDRATLDKPIKYYTYHHIREQSQELFGFSNLAGKKLFELLITVQGVGPKAALSILSLGDTETVRNGIANADSKYISQANGVGKKTAERVVVDLSDKVGVPTALGIMPSRQTELNVNDEALDALVALGYTLNDASIALNDIDIKLPTATRVTKALQKRNAR